MAITCLRNFISNGVKGSPGKQLSDEEIEIIGDLMAQLDREGLVMGAQDSAGGVVGSSPAAQAGEFEGAPVDGAIDSPAVFSEEKKSKKRKKA